MKFIVVVISLLLSFTAAAQEVKLVAKVSKEVIGQNESFRYVLTLYNARAKITLPSMPNFTVVQGPSVASRHSIVNGRTTQEYSETYILRPKRLGKYKITPAFATTSKGKVKSNTLIMEVVKGQAPAPQPQANAELMALVQVDKKKVYVGEPIVITYKVYTRYKEFGAEEINYPGTDGFWAEEVELNNDWKTETINGRTYYSIEAKRQILFPQTTGTLKIGTFSLTAVCRDRWYSSSKRLTASSKPIAIEVLPLPSGKKDNFIGSYSPLSITAKINQKEIKANEALNLTVKFEGKGNIKLLDEPDFAFPSDLEIFDPKLKDEIKIHAYGESGSRTFEYVIIPRSKGEYEIPEIKLNYFDYGRKIYRTINSGAINFTVLRGDESGNPNYTYDSKTHVNILNQDIRFIKRDSGKLRAFNKPFYGSITFMLLLTFPAGAFAFVLLIKQRRQRAEMDVEGTRTRRAGKVARRHLKEAAALVASDDGKLFYDSLSKAIFGYMGDKFNIPQSALTRDEIGDRLSENSGDKNAQNMIDLIEECEMARFAPVSGKSNKDVLDRATELVSRIERGK